MNTLVVYRLGSVPLRGTVKEHLYSFRHHSRHRYAYLNLAAAKPPRWLLGADFDAVIFHNSLLSARWTPETLAEMRRRAAPLKGLGRIRVALPQDEFLRSKQLCEFIEEYSIDLVASVAPEREWPKIYAWMDRDRVALRRVLTGYLDPHTLERIERLRQSVDRTIDIGYRARHHAPWLGRSGTLKGEISDRVAAAAAGRGLELDLSTDEDDVLTGDDWYRFLASCKYTIGAEGGASIHDHDGSVKERTDRYLAEHPDAGFDEVERACFPGRDGEFELTAISPRHLEACATGTCQILVEGEYNGILRAGEHYLPLRRDLSNLDEVLDEVQRDEVRSRLVEAAYRDVVESGRWSYAGFVQEIEQAIEEAIVPVAAAERPSAGRSSLVAGGARALEGLSWLKIALQWNVWRKVYFTAERLIPARVFGALQRLRARVASPRGS